MSDLRDSLDAAIRRHALFADREPVLIAVSGGLDSVVLLDLMARRGGPVAVAHVHHGLRGADADADAALVRRLAAERQVPFVTEHVDAAGVAARERRSPEEAARTARYRALERAAVGLGCAVVAVAHHRDDQTETVLMNLFRGAGLEGLAGMAPARPLRERGVRLVRPLLDVPRRAIEDYAVEQGLAWRHDRTNLDVTFRRNALRHRVLPAVREHFGPAAPAKVAEAAARVRAFLDATWRDELDRRYARCRLLDSPFDALAVEALRREPPVWQGRLVLEALRRARPEAPQRAAVADALTALIDAQPGRRVELAGLTVWRERDRLRFVPDAAPSSSAAALHPGGRVVVTGTAVEARVLGRVPPDLRAGAPRTVYLDADRLAWPLTVRPWEAGDRLRPLGLDGSRLVSDVLTDARVPPSERAHRLVALSGREVCWVVGHRIAHAFRVTAATRRVARLRCERQPAP